MESLITIMAAYENERKKVNGKYRSQFNISFHQILYFTHFKYLDSLLFGRRNCYTYLFFDQQQMFLAL